MIYTMTAPEDESVNKDIRYNCCNSVHNDYFLPVDM